MQKFLMIVILTLFIHILKLKQINVNRSYKINNIKFQIVMKNNMI